MSVQDVFVCVRERASENMKGSSEKLTFRCVMGGLSKSYMYNKCVCVCDRCIYMYVHVQ